MMASLEDVVAGAIPNVGDCFPKGSDNTQNKDKNNSLTKGSDNTQTKDSDRLLKAAPQSSPDQEDCPEIEIVFQQLPGNAKITRRSPLTTFPKPCFLLEKKSPYAAHRAEVHFDSSHQVFNKWSTSWSTRSQQVVLLRSCLISQ